MDIFRQKRIMRKNRQEAMSRGVFAVIDLGCSKSACFILASDPDLAGEMASSGGTSISPYYVVGSSSSPSAGIENGRIYDQEKLIDVINLILAKAQNHAKMRVGQVFVSFSGGKPLSAHCDGSVELNGETVSSTDISKALIDCRIPPARDGRDYLHAHPINFSIDNRHGIHDPRGEYGDRLTVDLQLITVNDSELSSLIGAIESCNVEIAGIAASPYVSSLSTLVSEEQETGSVCVDIGAGTVGVSMFYRRHMVHMSILKLGGDHITSDIASAFGISKAEAEKLKVREGGVLTSQIDDRTACEFKRLDNQLARITRTELIGVIKPRLEEILEEVALELDHADFAALPGKSIVLTGGGVHLVDLEDLAKSIFGQRLRLGRPVHIKGLPQAMKGPEYSSAVGLCLHAVQPQDEIWDFPTIESNMAMTSLERTLKYFLKSW